MADSNIIYLPLAMALFVLFLVVSKLKIGNFVSAFSVIGVWFSLWFCLALVNFLDFPEINFYAIHCYLVGLSAFLIGGFLFPIGHSRGNFQQASQKYGNRLAFFTLSVLVFLIPVYLAISIQTRSIFQLGNLFGMSEAAGSQEAFREDVFGSQSMYYYFYNFAWAFNIFCYLACGVLYIQYKRVYLLVFALLPSVLYTLTMSGRTNVYIASLVLISLTLIYPFRSKGRPVSSFWKVALIAGVISLTGFLIINTATERRTDQAPVVEAFEKYLYYHHLGFLLLGKELENEGYFPEQAGFGRSSTAGIATFIESVLRQGGLPVYFVYPYLERTKLDTPVYIEQGHVGNAYYTTFYHLWRDFGIIGVFFGMLGFGTITAYFSARSLRTGYIVFLFLTAFCLDFGLQSQFMSMLPRIQFGILLGYMAIVYLVPFERFIPANLYGWTGRLLGSHPLSIKAINKPA